MKKTKICLAIVTFILLGCLLAGGLFFFSNNFKPNIKEQEITTPQMVFKHPVYGTFCIEKMAGRLTNSSGYYETMSFVLKDKTNLWHIKQEIYDYYSSDRHSSHTDIDFSSETIDKFEFAVIPRYEILSNTQVDLESIDFDYKEKFDNANVFFHDNGAPYDKHNVAIYTLNSDVFSYNKDYEKVDVENRKFTIGLYNKSINMFLVYHDYSWIVQEGDELCFLVSDKNYIFSESFIENIFP